MRYLLVQIPNQIVVNTPTSPDVLKVIPTCSIHNPSNFLIIHKDTMKKKSQLNEGQLTQGQQPQSQVQGVFKIQNSNQDLHSHLHPHPPHNPLPTPQKVIPQIQPPQPIHRGLLDELKLAHLRIQHDQGRKPLSKLRHKPRKAVAGDIQLPQLRRFEVRDERT